MNTAIKARLDEHVIDAIFCDLDQTQLPGAAVAVAIAGEPVYRKGFGLANMEFPTILNSGTRMRIGSTTKHFACLAYLLLVEDGLAGIDDEIGTHVPGLAPINARATVRRLMNHTSGIRDLLTITTAFNGFGCALTDRQMIAYYQTIDDADFAPGDRWSYNNGAYMLIGAAIENISGQSLADFLAERIFTPLGMSDTHLRCWNSDFVPNSAALHFRDADGSFSRTYLAMETSGAGGIASSMDDMLKWMKHMDAPVVGTAQTWALMRDTAELNDGWPTNYGFGLVREHYRGVEVVQHSGTVLGGNSHMIKVPDARLDISIAANRSDVNAVALALRIIDECVEGLADPIEAKTPARCSGAFMSRKSGRVVELMGRDNACFMRIDGGGLIPVDYGEDDRFQLPPAMAFLQLNARFLGPDLVVSDFGREEVIQEIEIDPTAQLGDRAGCYRSAPFDVFFRFTEAPDGPRAKAWGRHGIVDYQMTPITKNVWRIEQDGVPFSCGIAIFDANGRGLTLNFGRMRNVKLARVAGSVDAVA